MTIAIGQATVGELEPRVPPTSLGAMPTGAGPMSSASNRNGAGRVPTRFLSRHENDGLLNLIIVANGHVASFRRHPRFGARVDVIPEVRMRARSIAHWVPG